MEHLAGMVQNYAWGSTTHLAGLRGAAASDEPEAELWLGAHPGNPSLLPERDDAPLTDRIAADPEGQLGVVSRTRFGDRLPYLLKLLAAAEPLSIQVHPTIEQAIEGCAREDALGIDRGAPNRSFRDDNHKPELIAALTPFEAMVGFRELEDTVRFLKSLDVPELAPVLSGLAGGIGSGLRTILELPKADAEPIVRALAAACAQVTGEWAAEAELLTRLDRKYPGDPGVLTAAMLNRIVLAPGEAVYLGAGNLHAYVEGFGVEIMANSDNVLRGGLTPKHMDVPALLDVVDPVAYRPEVLGVDGAVTTYRTPAPEFELTRIAVGEQPRTIRGAEIVVAVEGTTAVHDGDAERRLAPGGSAWVPASTGSYEVRTDGLAFVAALGEF